MKKILLLALSLTLVCDLWSQTFPDVKSVSDFVNDSIKRRADKINAGTLNKAYQGILYFVTDIVQDTTSITVPKHGMLRFQRKDSTGYAYDTIGYKRWRKFVPGTGGGGYSDEQAQDAVGAMASSEFTYNDAGNSLSINSISATKVSGNKTSAFISDFSSAVQAIGDPRYATVSHNHVAANITDFASAAKALFSGVNGVLYNNSTGVISADTFLLATKPGLKKSLDSVRGAIPTLYTSDGVITSARNVDAQGNPITFNSVGGFNVVGTATPGQWPTLNMSSTVAQLTFNQTGGVGVIRSQQQAAGHAPNIQLLSLNGSGHTSEFRIFDDSIILMPQAGQLNINSLRRSVDSTAYKPMGWNSLTGQWVALTYWPGSGTGGSAAADTLYATNGTQYLAGSGSNPDTVVLGGAFIRNTKISGVNLYGFKLDSLTYYALKVKDSVSWDVPKFAIRGLAKSVDTTTYKVQVIDPVTGDIKYAPWLAAGTGGTSYTFAQSLVNTSGTVALSGDLTSPGNNMLYGTNGTGVKGWYAQPAGAALTLQQVTDNGATTNHNITLGATTNNTAALVVNSYNKGILMHSITGGFDLNIDPSSIGAGAQGFNLYAISGDVGMESVGTGKRVILKANSVNTVVLDRSAVYQTDVTGTFRASGASTFSNYTGTGNALVNFDNGGQLVRSTIDPANVAQTSGSYADPAWITSLAASKVLPAMATNANKVLITDGSTSSWSLLNAANLNAGAVTLAKMENRATGTFIGRNTAGTGAPEELSIATAKTMLNLSGTNTGDQTISFTPTGDVTGTASSASNLTPTLTIGARKVLYSMMPSVTDNRLLGRSIGTNGDAQEITIGSNLSLAAGVLSYTGPLGTITGATNLGTGGQWYTSASGANLQFRSITTPTDGGISYVQNTNDIALANSAYDFYGKNAFTTTSTVAATGKYFAALPSSDCAGVITVEISGYQTGGATWTSTRSISFKKVGGTCTLGTEQIIKSVEALGAFSTPTIAWATSANFPILNITPGTATQTYWNVTFKVSEVALSL